MKGDNDMHIVLLNPEIPQNTGNIARTCAATGAKLDLIKPLGFEISDRYLKRAGLDYWHMMELRVHEDWAAFMARVSGCGAVLHIQEGSARLLSGAISGRAVLRVRAGERGLPEDMLRKHWERCVRIPMREGARSLNLSNSVAIITYEYLRQRDFAGLVKEGHLDAPEPAGGDWVDYV